MVTQDVLREVGAFQMLGPGDVEAIDTLVYGLQTMNFRRREFFCYHHDEVNIAGKIGIDLLPQALEVVAEELASPSQHPTVFSLVKECNGTDRRACTVTNTQGEAEESEAFAHDLIEVGKVLVVCNAVLPAHHMQ